MMNINILGNELRTIRKNAGQSLAETSKSIGVDRSHLNKVELGTYKPSLELLNQLLAHFTVRGNKASQLRLLVTEESFSPIIKEPQVERLEFGLEKERGNTYMADDSIQIQQPEQQVMFNPAQTPVLYTDSTFISSSEYGLVMDIAQKMPPGNQQHVVARVGMSFDHAKKLIEIMHDHLQKNER